MENITIQVTITQYQHHQIIERTGGVRDLNELKSALAQPHMTFNGKYKYMKKNYWIFQRGIRPAITG